MKRWIPRAKFSHCNILKYIIVLECDVQNPNTVAVNSADEHSSYCQAHGGRVVHTVLVKKS